MLVRQRIHTHSTELNSMTKLVEAVLNKNFDLANVMLEEKFASIMVKLIHEKKKMVAANICEDDIEESIDPKEISNGPAPAGQRVNRDDKGDKQPPNTTVVPKNNLKEEDLNEKRGLWDNIHAKRRRIKAGSGERMRKPGSECAPSEQDLKNSQMEESELYEARIKVIKARVRGGKVQRRVKKSNVAGMTLRGGKLTRMSPAERRRRKMGARKAKLKRKSQMGRILMKRKRSMNRRKAMGI
jgi:hypothetical protein